MDIKHTLEIAAPLEEVWALTIDVERWPELTPTMISVERLDGGPIELGSRARIKQPGMPSAVWTVTEFEPNQLFAWETKLGTITFRGGHRIETTGQGCRNTLSVDVSGLGSSVLRAVGRRRLLKAIVTENQGFKKAAEVTTPSAD